MGKPAGSLWLKNHFGLSSYRLTHNSYIGPREKLEVGPQGTIEQTYGPKYAPDHDTICEHLEFSLKYDDLSLDFLKSVFNRVEEKDIVSYIAERPAGKYSRKLGYLYEWLTGKTIPINVSISGNYVDLLEENKYFTGIIRKNIRWRVNDNLLGVQEFCPVVRKTEALKALLNVDLKADIEELKKSFSEEIFRRATQYLYRKETKSSYEIEKEDPSPDRMERFIALLQEAGKKTVAEVLLESNLTTIQNTIVDARYSVKGFRDFQNYVGQTNYRMEEIYDYICPPPEMVHSMMEGLIKTEEKSVGQPAVLRAGIIAFAFVFIHPFLDGNGRIHRFLIHDILTRDGFTGPNLIIPVSAHMLSNIKDYDQALENYSKPLLQRVRYTKSSNGQLTITNIKEVEGYFRYPDLTWQCLYLAQTIKDTIEEDLSEELFFLERYDELKRELQNVIDMPDRNLSQIIVFLHQNKGIFPNRRKKQFPEIKEEEFKKMEAIYKEVFES
jgi:Fic family protein